MHLLNYRKIARFVVFSSGISRKRGRKWAFRDIIFFLQHFAFTKKVQNNTSILVCKNLCQKHGLPLTLWYMTLGNSTPRKNSYTFLMETYRNRSTIRRWVRAPIESFSSAYFSMVTLAFEVSQTILVTGGALYAGLILACKKNLICTSYIKVTSGKKWN